MASNNLLMQLQADIAGIPICKFSYHKRAIDMTSFRFFNSVRSQTKDSTSLGCAIAAGRAEGIDLIDLSPQNRVYSAKVHRDTFLPTSTIEDRKARNKKWKMAVERSYGWATTIKSSTMTSNYETIYEETHQASSQMLCKLWDDSRELLFSQSFNNPFLPFIMISFLFITDERYTMLSSIPFTTFVISSFFLLALSEMYN